VLYRIKGDYPSAVEQAKEALKIKPYYPEAYINLSLAFLKEENFPLAESTLNAATTIYPFSTSLRFYLGMIYQKQGKPDEALREYELLLSEKSKSENLDYNLGLIFSKDDPAREGMSGLKAYAAYNSALIYLQKKEIDLAQQSLLRSIELKPDFAEAHATLGNLYDLNKEYQLAIRELQEATELNPDHPTYHYNLGLVFAKSGNLTFAKQEFQLALKLLPELKLAQEKLRLVDSLLSIHPSK
jgi:tetratricopeptide (TPR) repeat protein